MSPRNATFVRLFLYALCTGPLWRSVACIFVFGLQQGFQVWNQPMFWATMVITVPLAYLWNRGRRFVWGSGWVNQWARASVSFFIAIVFGFLSRMIPNPDGFSLWAALMFTFDGLGKLVGPEHPADPFVEWIVHKLLKRPRPEGMYAA